MSILEGGVSTLFFCGREKYGETGTGPGILLARLPAKVPKKLGNKSWKGAPTFVVSAPPSCQVRPRGDQALSKFCMANAQLARFCSTAFT